MVNYKISQWECQNQVLSLGLKASKQILFPKHFIAGREKAAGTPRLCLSIQKSFSKNLRSRSVSFPPDKLVNPVHFMVSWALGTRLKEEGWCNHASFGNAVSSLQLKRLMKLRCYSSIITAYLGDQHQNPFFSLSLCNSKKLRNIL